MKKLILSLVAVATIALSSFGQAPEGFKYQAVIRDAGNTILNNQAVGMRMTIQQGSIGGTTVYQETFSPTTNAYGLVNLEIGSGTPVSGDFTTIDWANGPYFIETAVDVTGGTSYAVMGTSQLMSVPYALHAKNSDSWTVNGDSTFTYNNVGIGTNNPSYPLEVVSAAVSGAHGLKLKRNANTINWGVPVTFNMFNTLNEDKKYGIIAAGIKDNTAGSEAGFLSFQVADGSGVFGVAYQQERLRVQTERVTVRDVLKIQPRQTAPLSPEKGDMYMSNTTNKLYVWDGTTWQPCW